MIKRRRLENHQREYSCMASFAFGRHSLCRPSRVARAPDRRRDKRSGDGDIMPSELRRHIILAGDDEEAMLYYRIFRR